MNANANCVQCPACERPFKSHRAFGIHARRCPVTVEQKFWMKVDKSGGPDACWPWLAARVPAGGYGRFWAADYLIAAHRYAYILTNGPIESSEIDVMHLCDNPPCCNPSHLKAVTTMENMQDAHAKGRHAHGERTHSAKLTDDLVRQIRQEFVRKSYRETNADELSAKYGVTKGSILLAARGVTWSHVK